MDPNCFVVLQHSCIDPANTSFFADPAVRLNQVIRALGDSHLTSACETTYLLTLAALANLAGRPQAESSGPAGRVRASYPAPRKRRRHAHQDVLTFRPVNGGDHVQVAVAVKVVVYVQVHAHVNAEM
jgi:hypothetical protein